MDFDWGVAVATVRGLCAVVGVGLVVRDVLSIVVMWFSLEVAKSRGQGSTLAEGTYFTKGVVGSILLALVWALGLVTP